MKDPVIVLASITAATGVTYAGQTVRKEPLTIRPLIGMFALGTLLLGVGIWNTSVASAFAVLVLITSLIVNGGEVFKVIDRLT